MLITIAIVVVLVVALGLVGVWVLAMKGMTPDRKTITQKPSMPYEEVTINNGEANLQGWFIPAVQDSGQKSPLVIVVHGWSSSKQRMLRYVDPLYEAGYSLLLFDVRGHGESDEVNGVTVKIFRDDIIAAIEYAQNRPDVDVNRIGLLGHSFGGFGSIIANKKPLGIKALVTDSMPTRFRTIMEASLSKYKLHYYPLGPLISRIMFFRGGIKVKELPQFDVPQALKQRKAPVLLIHSKNDHYVPASELTYLIESQQDEPNQASYLFVESDGHSNSHLDPRFWEQVLPFYDEHLNKNSD